MSLVPGFFLDESHGFAIRSTAGIQIALTVAVAATLGSFPARIFWVHSVLAFGETRKNAMLIKGW